MSSARTDTKTDTTPMMNAQIMQIHDITDDIRIVRMKPAEPLTYHPGQYMPVQWGTHEPRYYSIAGWDSEGTIEIHVKKGAGAISQYVLDELQEGDNVSVGHGIGSNIYDSGILSDKPLIMIAGGIGFTPQKAIIEAALAAHHEHSIRFFWGTNTAEEQYMAEYFESLAHDHDIFTYTPVIGGTMIDYVLKNAVITDDTAIFLAGSPPMINDALMKMHAANIDLSRIYFDDHPDIIVPQTNETDE